MEHGELLAGLAGHQQAGDQPQHAARGQLLLQQQVLSSPALDTEGIMPSIHAIGMTLI